MEEKLGSYFSFPRGDAINVYECSRKKNKLLKWFMHFLLLFFFFWLPLHKHSNHRPTLAPNILLQIWTEYEHKYFPLSMENKILCCSPFRSVLSSTITFGLRQWATHFPSRTFENLANTYSAYRQFLFLLLFAVSLFASLCLIRACL